MINNERPTAFVVNNNILSSRLNEARQSKLSTKRVRERQRPI